MGQILEYNAQPRDIPQPTDLAANTAREVGSQQNRLLRESGTAIGGAIARTGGELGQDYDNHIAGQMIGHGSAVSAELTANLTKQIDDTMSRADPNDISAGKGQRENVEKSIQAFQDQFADAPEKVQNWALSVSDHMRTHFGNSITAWEMSRAADAAEQNMRNTVRANANTVSLDPASLQGTIDLQHMNFDAYISTHTLPAGAVGKLRDQLDKADSALAYTAAEAIGRTNPDGMRAALARGDYDKYLDPQQKQHLEKYALEQESIIHTRKQWEHTEAKQQQLDVATTAKNDYITRALNGEKVGDYANDPRLATHPEFKENIKQFQHAIFQQAIDRSENTPHPQEWRNLIATLHDKQTNDPNNISDKPIYDLLAQGRLNKSEFANALAIYHSIDNPIEKTIAAQMHRAETFTASSIEGNTLKLTDANGFADALNRFELQGRTKITDARNKGEDVTPLITPGNKQFVFAPEVLKAMLPSAKATVKAGAETARKSGIEFDGFRWPSQDALDQYKKAKGIQ